MNNQGKTHSKKYGRQSQGHGREGHNPQPSKVVRSESIKNVMVENRTDELSVKEKGKKSMHLTNYSMILVITI